MFVTIGDSVYVMDGYEHILLDDHVPGRNLEPVGVFYGVVEGSLWDRVHQTYDIGFRMAHMYNLELLGRLDYPVTGGISESRGRRIDLVLR